MASSRRTTSSVCSTRPRRPSQQLPAMPDTESDHHLGDAAIARLDLVATPPAAPDTTSSICATGSGTSTVRDEDEEDGFTFAAAAIDVAIPRLQDHADDCTFPDAWIGGSPVYAVFGRPRSLPKQQQKHDEIEEVEEEDSASASGTANVRRGPLGRLLLEEPWCDAAAELDGVPAETYCLWSPGVSTSPPAPAGSSSRRTSPARCRKSGSTGSSSSVLRWRRRSRGDGKDVDKFVFQDTSSDRIGAGEGHGWINRGSPARDAGGKSSSTAFVQCRHDLVELVASVVTCGRRCYLF